MKENRVKKISDRNKVLLRPNRYIGNSQPYENETYIFDGSLFSKQKIVYTPGLIKIVREVIDNSIDEGIRTGFKFANEISVSVNDGWITVKDNGRGIPIIPLEGEDVDVGGLLMPEGAWALLNTGANFDDDDDNTTMGQNGEGVALTNIFSKEFIGTTKDGTRSFVLKAVNNLENYTIRKGVSKEKGTEVKFLPDYERLGVDTFDKSHEMVLMTDLVNLSLAYPKIKFVYNKKLIKASNFKDYVKLFGIDACEVVESKNLSIAIMHNSEDMFGFVHYINGLNVYNGGKPLDWVMKNVTQNISDKLIKKYPNIKVGDIKSKLFAVVNFYDMVNPRFEDQVKSICSNSLSDFRPQIEEPDWDKFAGRIVKNTAITEPITDVYRLKEELQKSKEMQSLEKKTKKITSEKYYPSIGSKKYLMITEGESATGGLMPVLGRKDIAYYELKGKPMNVLRATHKDFMSNVELKDLYEIIKSEGFSYIIFATDQDLDGIHIRGLGITFSYVYLPQLLKNKQIGMLQTPLLGIKKDNKLVDWVYRIDDLTAEHTKKGSIKYYKGLGTWKPNDLKVVVERDKIDKMVEMFEYDEDSENTIIGWFDKDKVDYRKEKILQNEFSLIKL